MYTLCSVIEFESGSVDGSVSSKLEEQRTVTDDGWRRLGTAVTAHERTRCAVALIGREAIVSAERMTLNIESIDKLSNDQRIGSGRDCVVAHETVTVALRIIGRSDLTARFAKFATTSHLPPHL